MGLIGALKISMENTLSKEQRRRPEDMELL
jgi:hypothetical protein